MFALPLSVCDQQVGMVVCAALRQDRARSLTLTAVTILTVTPSGTRMEIPRQVLWLNNVLVELLNQNGSQGLNKLLGL